MLHKKVRITDTEGNLIREGTPRVAEIFGGSGFWNGIILLFIASIFGVIGWSSTQILTDVKNDVVDIKETQGKMWAAMTGSQQKIECIQSQISKCCKDSTYCA